MGLITKALFWGGTLLMGAYVIARRGHTFAAPGTASGGGDSSGSSGSGGGIVGDVSNPWTLASDRDRFIQSIVARARPYADYLLAAGMTANVSPFVLYGIMETESRSGEALSPPNPSGTGDGGHGRGLMQVDDRTWAEWLASSNWWDAAVNIAKGAAIYAGGIAYFNQMLPSLQGRELTRAALAAYNAGPARVKRAIEAGQDPDSVTTGGRYSQLVLAKADVAKAAFDSLGRVA